MAFVRASVDAVALVVVAVADLQALTGTTLACEPGWQDLAWSDALTGRIQGQHRLDSLATVLGGMTYAVLIGRRQVAGVRVALRGDVLLPEQVL